MSRFFLILLVATLALPAWGQSRDALELRIAQAPDDADARRALSDLLTAQGEPAAAVPHLVWLADHAPADADLRRQLAQTLIWSDRSADAADALAEVVALDPSDVEARVQLAEIITWDGGAGRAVDLLAPVADDRPGNARLHRILAFAMLASGDPGARAQMTRALALQPDDLDLLIESAGAERWQGDWSVAQQRLGAALALDLTPDQQMRIRALQLGIRTLSAATLHLGGARVSDSNGVTRLDTPGRLDIPVSGRWTVGAEITHTDIDGRGDRRAMGARYVPYVTYQPSRSVRLDVAAGVEGRPGGALATVGRASAQRIWTASGFALARVTAQTATATDAAGAYGLGLRRSTLTAEGYAEPSASLALSGSLAGLAYSDGNRRLQASAAARWLPLDLGRQPDALPLASFGLTAGLGYEDSQTIYADAVPYYTPEHLLTTSAGLALRVVAGGLRLDGTLGMAHQLEGTTSLEYGLALEVDRGTEAVRVEVRRVGSSAYSADVFGLTARFRLP